MKISFDEPILVGESGEVYNFKGFQEELAQMEKDDPTNWSNAVEAYGCDTMEEFIEQSGSAFFLHDFPTLSFYKGGLKEVAETLSEHLPYDKDAAWTETKGEILPIKDENNEITGFLIPILSEEDSGEYANSYFIDDAYGWCIPGLRGCVDPETGVYARYEDEYIEDHTEWNDKE